MGCEVRTADFEGQTSLLPVRLVRPSQSAQAAELGCEEGWEGGLARHDDEDASAAATATAGDACSLKVACTNTAGDACSLNCSRHSHIDHLEKHGVQSSACTNAMHERCSETGHDRSMHTKPGFHKDLSYASIDSCRIVFASRSRCFLNGAPVFRTETCDE